MTDLRLVSSNDRPDPLVGALDRAITNVDRALEIANELEVRLSEERQPDFASGLKIGLFIGCVAGSWLTVAIVFVWELFQ
jgi:hypothetical protein